MRNSFIVLAGNIGSGKTTLAQLLEENSIAKAHFESVQDNPYLEDFYQDMNKFSFPLQIYFLNNRFKKHQQLQVSGGVNVQDRSIYEDAHIFARSLFDQKILSKRDYETYLESYHTYLHFLTPPKLVCYLQRSLTKLKERIDLRDRECEKTMTLDYLESLNIYYDEWFDNYDLGPKIKINTDSLDFLNSSNDFQGLISQIDPYISKQAAEKAS